MLRNTVNKDDYLSSDFKPERVANALIRETTAPQDSAVDITPTLTRLKYDLEEIEREIEHICRENTDALLQHTERTDSIYGELANLRQARENMTGTYAKLEHDFLEPYNRATRLNSAAIKLYSTAQLSRSLSWYLQLALQAQSQEFKRETVVASGGAGSALLRTAHALNALSKLIRDVPDLRSIHVVDEFETKVPQLKETVVDSATKFIKDFDGTDAGQMRMAASALIVMGADLSHTFESHTRALVGSTVLQLSRNSGSAIEHRRAFEDAQKRAAAVSALDKVYKELSGKSDTIGTASYWPQVATQLDQKLKTMSVANPSAIRSMTMNRDAILLNTSSVQEVHSVFTKYLST